MDPTPRNVNDRPHLNELGDVLRSAVEQVRVRALPQEVLSRALGRVRALGQPVVKPWRRPEVRMLAAAAAAALIAIALGLWARQYITGLNQLAPLREPARGEDNYSNDDVLDPRGEGFSNIDFGVDSGLQTNNRNDLRQIRPVRDRPGRFPPAARKHQPAKAP